MASATQEGTVAEESPSELLSELTRWAASCTEWSTLRVAFAGTDVESAAEGFAALAVVLERESAHPLLAIETAAIETNSSIRRAATHWRLPPTPDLLFIVTIHIGPNTKRLRAESKKPIDHIAGRLPPPADDIDR